MSLDQLTDCA